MQATKDVLSILWQTPRTNKTVMDHRHRPKKHNNNEVEDNDEMMAAIISFFQLIESSGTLKLVMYQSSSVNFSMCRATFKAPKKCKTQYQRIESRVLEKLPLRNPFE